MKGSVKLKTKNNKKKYISVQTGREENRFNLNFLDYVPFEYGSFRLYKAMRKAVPIIDAALDKIVRLTGNFNVTAEKPQYQAELDNFIRNVRVGGGLYGLKQFIAVYLDSLITYGNAVGEIVLSPYGDDIYALYNADISRVAVKKGENVFEAEIGTVNNGKFERVKYPGLILFTPLNPEAGELMGRSLLCSLPFVTDILLKIYSSVSTNFERIANLKYAVTYRPDSSTADLDAKEIADSIAEEWRYVMSENSMGKVRDFVAVGDVGIKVIGADNQMINTEIPVRQMLEQIVAKLGIPPFMLGLHWSTTERMSAQQADILTSELESYRFLLSSIITKVCDTWFKVRGVGCGINITWDDINLKDELESAQARLINIQARSLECKMGGEETENI